MMEQVRLGVCDLQHRTQKLLMILRRPTPMTGPFKFSLVNAWFLRKHLLRWEFLENSGEVP
jgi:hypothetical protein